ncbi:MAG: hypothetical protein ACYTGW_22165 [Planctomycetota bacterium]
MTSSVLIYLAITLVAAVLCLWTGASAAPKVREHGSSHRLVTSIGATLLLPAAAVAMLATPLGYPVLTWGTFLLPVAVLCGTWSNVMTLRDQGWLLKLLHLPIFLLNTTLLGLYTLRVSQDFLGQDLGTWGSALTIAHVTLQSDVGDVAAAVNPIWFHLPFLLPLCLRFRWHHMVALVLSSMISIPLLVLLVMAMPMAHARADSYRNPTPARNRQVQPELAPQLKPVGVMLPWGRQLLPASTRWHIRQALLDLRPDAVTIEVLANTFANQELRTQAERELAWVREQGMEVTVICVPSRTYQVIPMASLEALRGKMAETQWLAAENLRPDLLVLFAGPFGELAATTHVAPTIDEWVAAIAQSAAEARRANPDVQLGVAIESVAPHAAELFRRLRAEGSPVDVVGLAIFARQRLVPDLDKDLLKLRRWIARTPGSARVQVLLAGCTPHAVGGELGHWNFLDRVLALGETTEGIGAVCIDALHDPQSTRGLLTWTGRRRLAFQELRARTTASRPGK